jgi:hypothetical protein
VTSGFVDQRSIQLSYGRGPGSTPGPRLYELTCAATRGTRTSMALIGGMRQKGAIAGSVADQRGSAGIEHSGAAGLR